MEASCKRNMKRLGPTECGGEVMEDQENLGERRKLGFEENVLQSKWM